MFRPGVTREWVCQRSERNRRRWRPYDMLAEVTHGEIRRDFRGAIDPLLSWMERSAEKVKNTKAKSKNTETWRKKRCQRKPKKILYSKQRPPLWQLFPPV
ncbi:hypothetical protein BHE74_00002091 [Ensete ventricosum]|uniref:Uncharacterized protein n=1 Tax=Ensete ventricosum TaxID=4639 RepID=A0A445M8U6_ENSVE|nr:hypothetical protein BHE74_00002091 [Ensete ventricosum]RZR70660.1 hypothetical protein BHM03_00001029 [Ensete ventricosum]